MACLEKPEITPVDTPDMLSLNIPDGFNFEVTKEHSVTWQIDGMPENSAYKAEVWVDGKLLRSAIISNSPNLMPISIPIHLNEVEMVLTTDDGTEYTQEANKGNDLVFELDLNTEESDQQGAAAPNNLPSKKKADADGDKVVDELDLEPLNPEVSQAIYIPALETYNTIGFEDTWPKNGDYDYNDLVVSFNLNKYLDKSNNLSRVETDFKVMAVGAGYDNDFCYTLEIPIDEVQVEIESETPIQYELHGNEDYTEVRFPSIKQAFGTTQFVNTVEEERFYDWLTFKVITTIGSEKRVNGTSLPYDFFIRINGEEGREVHMAGKHPTGKVNRSYFGTGDDNSLPGKGKLYLNDRNLPWAVMIPEVWEYPLEKTEILEAYPDFAEFAQKNENFPWFSDFHGGKIVRSKLYKKRKK